jgi:hypothetical protein
MSQQVKLPAIFSGIQSKVDGSYKLTFGTRELSGADAAVLLGMANKEAWLLISPDDSLDAVDVPKAKPDSGTGQKTPGARLRAVLFVLWNQSGRPGDFEEWYRLKLERLIDQYKAKLDGEDIT